MPTLSDIEEAAYAQTDDVHDSFNEVEFGHQFVNDGFRSATKYHIRRVLDRHEDEFDGGEAGVDTVHAIAMSVREYVETLVTEPGDYAFEENQASYAAKVVGENYEAVSAAYEQYGYGSDGLDDSLLVAVNAYYRQCAHEVAKHWEDKSVDFYVAIYDLM